MVSTELLRVHSLAEAQLFLMVRPCQRCRKGPLKLVHHRMAPEGERLVDRMEVACGSCGWEEQLVFDVSGAEDLDAAGKNALLRINPSDDPSQVIDVAEWLTLFAVLADAAGRETDKGESRRLGYEAAQCLEEALKFYERDNDLPPEWAFFNERSKDRFRRHTEQYDRQRLLELRSKLPSLTVMEERISEKPGKRKWWRFWRSR